MKILYRFKYFFGRWVSTIFGAMPKAQYDIEINGPIPRLLKMVINGGGHKNEIELIRLNESKQYGTVQGKSELESMIMKMSLELTGRKDYGYELAGIPVDDTIVNYLVMWTLELYPRQTTLSPRSNVIFSIKSAA
jgi:hypothetical protein